VASDVLTRFEGVRVVSKSDTLPPSDTQQVRVDVRRGIETHERVVSLDGFERAAPRGLLGAAFMVACACLGLLLFVGPTSRHLVWLERRLGQRLSLGFPDRRDLLRALRKEPLARFYAPAAAVLVLATLPLVEFLIAADLDVALLFGATLGSRLALAWTPHPIELRRLLGVMAREAPAPLAVIGIVALTGSLRLQELVSSQGGWPWEWYATRAPFLLFVVFMAWLVRAVANRNEPTAPWKPRTFTFVVLASALVSTLFLGGWQLPGLEPAQQESHVGLRLLGSVFFVVKMGAVALFVRLVQTVLPRLHGTQRWHWGIPLAVLGIAVAGGWNALGAPRSAELLGSTALLGMGVVVLLRLAVGVWKELRPTSSPARLNPFL
jgi:NADH-quinone oxidoreductase subunit H